MVIYCPCQLCSLGSSTICQLQVYTTSSASAFQQLCWLFLEHLSFSDDVQGTGEHGSDEKAKVSTSSTVNLSKTLTQKDAEILRLEKELSSILQQKEKKGSLLWI